MFYLTILTFSSQNRVIYIYTHNSDFKTRNCEFISRKSEKKSELWDVNWKSHNYPFYTVVEASFHVDVHHNMKEKSLKFSFRFS